MNSANFQICRSPIGEEDELVDEQYLSEPTKKLTKDQLAALLAKSEVHTKPTVQMPAVKPRS